ncbi:MAG: glycosyltransferase [Bacteroidetes bacterium]|nr:glycosyltransferase [Bacteroidota bacterium]
MKILQVSNRVPYPLNEGGTIGIYNYTKGFCELENDVTFVTLNAVKHKIDIEDAKKELNKYCKFHYLNINTDIKISKAFLNLLTKKSYNIERFYSSEFDKLLENILSNEKFDIIQVEGIYASMYLKTIRNFSKSPVVLRQHNVEFQIWERLCRNEKNGLKKLYLKLLSKRLKNYEKAQLNLYDAIIPVTNDDADVFTNEGCTKPIFVSPAGIEDSKFEKYKGVKANPKYVYHLGSLEWMPNREAVIWFIENVWEKIQTIDSSYKLFIAGKNMPDFFKKYQTESIVIEGEIENALDFISDKCINIVPLLSGSGIRLKILEAMAAGKLVIATTVGAQGINYTKDKNILIANTVDEYCEIFKKHSQHTECFDFIKQNAVKLINDEYSNKAVVKKLLNFYKTSFNIS